MAKLTTSAYIALLEKIATQHKSIGHKEGEKHFARVRLNPVSMPWQKDSLEEFVTDQRSKMKFPYMVGFYPITTITDNRSDNKQQKIDGSFALLEKRSKGDFDTEEAIYDAMEAIAWQIFAYIKKDYEKSENRARQTFKVDSIIIQNIGPINGTLYGIRADFQLIHYANDDFDFDETLWDIPEEN